DPRPECRQLVTQADTAERRADRRRREAAEQLPLVHREGLAHELHDAAVRTPQGRRQVRADREELAIAAREVARIGAPERAGIARRSVAEHQVVAGHWTMK